MWRSMRSTSRRAKHSKHKRSTSTSFIHCSPSPSTRDPRYLATSLPRHLEPRGVAATSCSLGPLARLRVAHRRRRRRCGKGACGSTRHESARGRCGHHALVALVALVHDDRGDAICVDHTLGIVCWYVRRGRGAASAVRRGCDIQCWDARAHDLDIALVESLISFARERERAGVRANAPMCLCLTRTPASCPTEFDINVGNCLTATYPAFTLDRYSHQFLVRRRRRRR